MPEFPHPVPSDKELEEYFETRIQTHSHAVAELLEELNDTVRDTEDSGQPSAFAYGKLLNKLATLKQTELIVLLAGAMWELAD